MTRRTFDMTKKAIIQTKIATASSNQHSTRTSGYSTPLRTRDSKTTTFDVTLFIDGLDVVAVIDTGADNSVMSGSLATKLKKGATSWDGRKYAQQEAISARLVEAVRRASP